MSHRGGCTTFAMLLGVLMTLFLRSAEGQTEERKQYLLSKVAEYDNCLDKLQNSVHGIAWIKNQHNGKAWGNGQNCKDSGWPLSGNSKFCVDDGWTCEAYRSFGWCRDGYVMPTYRNSRAGPAFNMPENNCCACGGGMCIVEDHCWQTLGGLAVEEGEGAVPTLQGWHTLDQCKKECDALDSCNSMAYSAHDGGQCHLKKKTVFADEPTRPYGDKRRFYHTYYKLHTTTTTTTAPTGNGLVPVPAPPTSSPTTRPTPAFNGAARLTTLTTAAAAGSTTLQVASTQPFAVGSIVKVRYGNKLELNRVKGIGSLLLYKPLKYDYPVGASVVNMDVTEMWFASDAGQSCHSTCDAFGLSCSQATTASHNAEVDSSAEVHSWIEHLTGHTQSQSCQGVTTNAPSWTTGQCFYSSSGSTIGCGSAGTNSQSLCYCAEDTSSALSTTHAAPFFPMPTTTSEPQADQAPTGTLGTAPETPAPGAPAAVPTPTGSNVIPGGVPVGIPPTSPPTARPTVKPTPVPTTPPPTTSPTRLPTPSPTRVPTAPPTVKPTPLPTSHPTTPVPPPGATPAPTANWIDGAKVSTQLTTPVSAGATELAVGSTAGFAVGDTVRIGTVTQSELNKVAGFGSIKLQYPLQNSYPAGASIVVVQAQWLTTDTAAACEVNSEGITRTFGGEGFTLQGCKQKCEGSDTCRAIDFYKETGWCNTYDIPCKNPQATNDGASSFVLEALPMTDNGQEGCNSTSPCTRCHGHCIADSDCGATLKCFHRSADVNDVPGCTKGGNGDVGATDYCYQEVPTPGPTAASTAQSQAAVPVPTAAPTVQSQAPTPSPTRAPTSGKKLSIFSADITPEPTAASNPTPEPTSHGHTPGSITGDGEYNTFYSSTGGGPGGFPIYAWMLVGLLVVACGVAVAVAMHQIFFKKKRAKRSVQAGDFDDDDDDEEEEADEDDDDDSNLVARISSSREVEIAGRPALPPRYVDSLDRDLEADEEDEEDEESVEMRHVATIHHPPKRHPHYPPRHHHRYHRLSVSSTGSAGSAAPVIEYHQ